MSIRSHTNTHTNIRTHAHALAIHCVYHVSGINQPPTSLIKEICPTTITLVFLLYNIALRLQNFICNHHRYSLRFTTTIAAALTNSTALPKKVKLLPFVHRFSSQKVVIGRVHHSHSAIYRHESKYPTYVHILVLCDEEFNQITK